MGELRCRPESRTFGELGPVSNHVVAFPRVPVRFQPRGRAAFIVHPGTAMFMNRGDVWSRRALAPDGSYCAWFGMDAAAVAGIFAEAGGVRGTCEKPMTVPMTHLAPPQVLAAAEVVAAIKSGPHDPERLREEALALLAHVARRAHRHTVTRSAREESRALAHATRDRLSTAPHVRWSLDELAAVEGVSVAAVCAAYRREFGTSIHADQIRARLNRAVEHLSGASVDLTELALDLGFSSHSHFTFAFRRQFGLTPSRLRQRLKNGGLGVVPCARHRG